MRQDLRVDLSAFIRIDRLKHGTQSDKARPLRPIVTKPLQADLRTRKTLGPAAAALGVATSRRTPLASRNTCERVRRHAVRRAIGKLQAAASTRTRRAPRHAGARSPSAASAARTLDSCSPQAGGTEAAPPRELGGAGLDQQVGPSWTVELHLLLRPRARLASFVRGCAGWGSRRRSADLVSTRQTSAWRAMYSPKTGRKERKRMHNLSKPGGAGAGGGLPARASDHAHWQSRRVASECSHGTTQGAMPTGATQPEGPWASRKMAVVRATVASTFKNTSAAPRRSPPPTGSRPRRR